MTKSDLIEVVAKKQPALPAAAVERAVTEGRNVSDLVRDAFDAYLGSGE